MSKLHSTVFLHFNYCCSSTRRKSTVFCVI